MGWGESSGQWIVVIGPSQTQKESLQARHWVWSSRLREREAGKIYAVALGVVEPKAILSKSATVLALSFSMMLAR